MQIKKGELPLANAFIAQHFDRIVDWSIGDIRRCCRMNQDGTCKKGGALVGAFILWCCAIEYFGGLYTGFTETSMTKARFREFVGKYMPQYDWSQVEELRWSLQHYYSPHVYVLFHERDLQFNKPIHLTNSSDGIRLHLGWAVKDLEDAVEKYHADLDQDDDLKVKLWRYYNAQMPIMPIKMAVTFPTLSSMATGTAIQSVIASGTVSPTQWFKN